MWGCYLNEPDHKAKLSLKLVNDRNVEESEMLGYKNSCMQ